MKQKICSNANCGKEFMPTTNRQRYCSEDCRLQAYKPRPPYQGTAPGTVGAIQELRVSVDLLTKGYEVFRALSPNCSSDLIAMKNNKILRIEVRTGYYRPKGIQFPKDRFKADHFAVVLPDQILYMPPLGE